MAARSQLTNHVGVESPDRPARADAQRSYDAVLEAAKAVFAISGVDAPVREIAAKAGVGIATLYRRFPKRSDLIVAIFRRELDACAAAATEFAAAYPPFEALSRWMQRYIAFVAAKQGLAAALHSGDPAYEPLRDYFDAQLKPALRMLLERAAIAGAIRADVDADELIPAVTSLCSGANSPAGLARARRMVGVLTDGLRTGASD